MSSSWVSLLVVLAVTLPLMNALCPENCKCQLEKDVLTSLNCRSFDFIHKLSVKEKSTIKSLDLSHSDLYKINKKIKTLVNLEKLNLSHNKLTEIKHFPFRIFWKLKHLDLSNNLIKNFRGPLPNSLEELNLANNYFKNFPEDVITSDLKVVNISGNSFSCTRESLDVRDKLLEKHIKFIGRASCGSPSKFVGQSWLHADELDEFLEFNSNEMMGDEPGSGHSSITTTEPQINIFDHKHHFPKQNEDDLKGEDDFIFEGSGVIPYVPKVKDRNEDEEDGSGDGSGVGLPDDIRDTSDDNYEKINETFTTIVPVIEEIVTKKVSDVSNPQNVIEEEPLQKESESSQEEDSNFGTTIFLIIMAICVVIIIVYFIKKRKRNNFRRNDDVEKETTAEILPKTPNEKQNGNPEASPLVNGQNHEPEEDETKFSYTPVEVPQKDDNLSSYNPEKSSPKSSNQDVVSVKVKATETPVPRTPVLVDKRRTSDGQTIMQTVNGDHQK